MQCVECGRGSSAHAPDPPSSVPSLLDPSSESESSEASPDEALSYFETSSASTSSADPGESCEWVAGSVWAQRAASAAMQPTSGLSGSDSIDALLVAVSASVENLAGVWTSSSSASDT